MVAYFDYSGPNIPSQITLFLKAMLSAELGLHCCSTWNYSIAAYSGWESLLLNMVLGFTLFPTKCDFRKQHGTQLSAFVWQFVFVLFQSQL